MLPWNYRTLFRCCWRNHWLDLGKSSMKYEMALKVWWTNNTFRHHQPSSTYELALHMQILARYALPLQDLTIANQAGSVVTYSHQWRWRITRRRRGSSLCHCLPEFDAPLTCPWIGGRGWRVEIGKGIWRDVTESFSHSFSLFVAARTGFSHLHGRPCSCRKICLFALGGGSRRIADLVVPPWSGPMVL
jgi:hypothetical protein